MGKIVYRISDSFFLLLGLLIRLFLLLLLLNLLLVLGVDLHLFVQLHHHHFDIDFILPNFLRLSLQLKLLQAFLFEVSLLGWQKFLTFLGHLVLCLLFLILFLILLAILQFYFKSLGLFLLIVENTLQL